MGKHFLIWLMIIIFTPLALPALLSPKTMSLTIRKDYNTAISIFGEKDEMNKELITLYKSNLTSIAAFANDNEIGMTIQKSSETAAIILEKR